MRRQPPVHSPLSFAALARAALPAAAGGNACARLRDVLAREYDAPHVLLLGSGTTALRHALAAAADRAGRDAIIAIPAFTCFDVAAAAVAVGRPVTLFDIDPATLGPDPDSLRRALDDGARVVVISPLYGVPVDWDVIARMAAEAGAILIEDAAQGHGAAWQGRPLGSLGPLSILSFGRGKGWTGGRGGAFLVRAAFGGDVAPLAAGAGGLLRELATLGAAAAQHGLARPQLYALPAALPWLGLGETRYRECGLPRGLPHAAAALLLATRAAAGREAAARREAGRQYDEALAARGHAGRIQPPAGAEPGFLRYPLLVRGGIHAFRDASRARRLGAAPSYPAPLSTLAPLAPLMVVSRSAWPGAETLARDLVTLPTHSLISRREREELMRLVPDARS